MRVHEVVILDDFNLPSLLWSDDCVFGGECF